MPTPNELYNELEAATNAFIQLVSSFGQEEINTVPFAGSWTVAQITEHVFKSDNVIMKALYGPVQSSSRPADENVGNMRSIFLDFNTKLKTPDFIIPDDIIHDKDSLLSAFKSVRVLLGKAIKTLDLSPICDMPIFGEPTRLELITFVIFHTQRHTNQVQQIFEKMVHA